jgi:modification target Cys-rich repeat protein
VEGNAAADCSGTCNGTCTGQCSATNGSGQCAGKCEGNCQGSCEVEFEAEASCEGTCKGECTVTNPEGGCEGGVRASCEAMGSAMVMCEGRCDGEVTPPSAKAECQASAKAEASFNAECTPPRVGIHYELAVGGNVDVEAQARFEAALKNLEVRLPRLLASLKSADVMVDAAAELGAAGQAAVEGAIEELQGDADVKATIGLACAAGELDEVAAVISSGTSRLTGSVEASAELTTALGLD